MACPPCERQRRRLRTQLPHCYYEGYMEIRSVKEKISQHLWASLCGNTLFFYNTNKDNEYVDKIELSSFVCVKDDSTRDRNFKPAQLNLRTAAGEFKITFPSLEACEVWKGYIHAVAELSVPGSLNLLPGQLCLLQEVIEKERERQSAASAPEVPPNDLYLPLVAEMPSCYHNVSRSEAMSLLMSYANYGNMLLRPSKDGALAVTTRQDRNGIQYHNYHVSRRPEGGFVIELRPPITCETLHDVISHLVEISRGSLQPLDTIYDVNFAFGQQNNENGEKNPKCASGSSSTKVVQLVSPEVLREVSCEPHVPSASSSKETPSPDSDSEENIYLNDEDKWKLEEPPPRPPKPFPKSRKVEEHQIDSDVYPPLLLPRTGTDRPPEKLPLKPLAPVPAPHKLTKIISKPPLPADAVTEKVTLRTDQPPEEVPLKPLAPVPAPRKLTKIISKPPLPADAVTEKVTLTCMDTGLALPG